MDKISGKNLDRAAQICAGYLSNNTMQAEHVPSFIAKVFGAVHDISQGYASLVTTRDPAVPVSKSIHDNYLICLEDGVKRKMLKPYLDRKYSMSPEQYRKKWGLPEDYPMVAPSLSKKRRDTANSIGLGDTVRDKPKKKKNR